MKAGWMRGALATAALLLAVPAMATEDDLRSVSGMLNHNRVLLVFSPSFGDQRLAQQRRGFARLGAVAATRDLVLVQVAAGKVIGAHDAADKLRRKFNAADTGYRTILIDKDGRVVIDQAQPIDETRLAAAIGLGQR